MLAKILGVLSALGVLVMFGFAYAAVAIEGSNGRLADAAGLTFGLAALFAMGAVFTVLAEDL